MKRNIFLICCFALLSLFSLCSFAQTGFREKNTSLGKVIIELDKESALNKFGIPTQASKELWYYSIPEKFFIFFPAQQLLNIYLYPLNCNTYVDTPLEFKAFGYFTDMRIKDITKEVQLLISRPEDFTLGRPGSIIPKKAGEYQVLAKYNNTFSNPAHIKIGEPQEKKTEKYTERLISINILPYKPAVTYKSRLEFTALGVFMDSSGTYAIRDISKQVSWYVKQNKNAIENEGNTIFFSALGKVTVFCRYYGMEGFSQEIDVQDKAFILGEALKHITLLPDIVLAASGKNVNLKAFGTYYNNKVEDITSKVDWEVSDKDIIEAEGMGAFSTKSVGITDVTAVSNDLQGLATKIIVRDKIEAELLDQPEEKKIKPENLYEDIKKEVDKIKESFAKEDRKLSFIRIIPDTLEIPFGESSQLTAQGIYSDNSQEDLTLLGDWESSDSKVVKVLGGKVDTFSPGEAKIYIKFKGVNSLPALVKVVGPKLVSIIISPQELQLTMKDKPALKAEGYFTDSSRKDITQLADWKVTDSRVIKVEKGRVSPLKFGKTKVYAGHLGIISMPANIKIIFTLDWLMYMVIKLLFFLFLCTVAMFGVFFILTQKRKNDLRNSLDKNPSEFIVNLYDNTKKILAVFNLTYKEGVTPLFYAELVQKSCSIKNDLFLRFTAKFEEARYSHHVLTVNDASLALNDYNDFLKVLFKRHTKLSLFIKYCLILLSRSPLLISYP